MGVTSALPLLLFHVELVRPGQGFHTKKNRLGNCIFVSLTPINVTPGKYNQQFRVVTKALKNPYQCADMGTVFFLMLLIYPSPRK